MNPNIMRKYKIATGLTFALLSLLGPKPTQASETTCSGILTDQRAVGLSLGECDLNSVSDEEFRKITNVCGQPNGVGEDTNKTTCHVRGVFVPKKGIPGIVIIKKVIGVTAGVSHPLIAPKTQPQKRQQSTKKRFIFEVHPILLQLF
jgi:hypothetical protein